MPIVVVTGATSGIGKATAAALVKADYTVIGTSRNADSIPPEKRIPGVEYRDLDLTDPDSIARFVTGLGPVDALINNAGESQIGPMEEVPREAIESLFQLHVFGPVDLAQRLLPGMRERGSGRIIMVGSMLASFPTPHLSTYVASKAALKGFASAARLELAPFGVQIATLEPGSINTGLRERRIAYVGEQSPYRQHYQTVRAKLDAHQAEGISPDNVAAVILGALNDTHMKPLYAVGSNASLAFTARRLMPRAFMERIIAKSHGL